jgi:hypothetical protein
MRFSYAALSLLLLTSPGSAGLTNTKLALCVMKGSGEVLYNLEDIFAKGPYASVHSVESLDEAQGCDAVVRIRKVPNSWSLTLKADVLSGSSKKLVYRTSDEGAALSSFADLLQPALSPGGDAYEAVMNEKNAAAAPAPAPYVAPRVQYVQAPAPAPAPSISKEDLTAAVKAAMAESGQQTAKPEAAPAAPAPRARASGVDRPRYHRPERPDDFALVIGIDKYSDIPAAQFAERDAEALRAHLLALGWPERNVAVLEGSHASMGGLKKYIETWLPKNVGPNSTVFVYFSGHGAPDPATNQAYLVPWDGDPQFLADTAYPLQRLYQRLEALPAKRVIVALDACFSGAGGRSVLPKGARPLVSKIDVSGPRSGRVVSLSASGSDQITGTIDEQEHGLFTYYLLEGLNGGAADGAGRVTLGSLFDYVKPKVQDRARRQNRDQTPQLSAAAGAEPVVLR